MSILKALNEFNQVIGSPVDWPGAKKPQRDIIRGRFCQIEPLDAGLHASDLYRVFTKDQDASLWTYLPFGPFDNEQQFEQLVTGMSLSKDSVFYTIVDLSTAKPVGIAAYLRIKPDSGSIEIGSIVFSSRLQKTAAATEAMFLLMRYAFKALGYRRYEWKCDSLNAPSRRAAERLGFQYEGLFKQALVYKGRNRDTAWYSVLDKGWPSLEQGFERWLDKSNFDAADRQRYSLKELIGTTS